MKYKKKIICFAMIMLLTICSVSNVFVADTAEIDDEYAELVSLYNEAIEVFPNVELMKPLEYQEYIRKKNNLRCDQIISASIIEEYHTVVDDIEYNLYVMEDRSFILTSIATPSVTVTQDTNNLTKFYIKWKWFGGVSYSRVNITLYRLYDSSTGKYKFDSVSYSNFTLSYVSVHYFARETVYYNQVTFKGNALLYDDSTGLLEPQFGFNIVIRTDRITGSVTATHQHSLTCY